MHPKITDCQVGEGIWTIFLKFYCCMKNPFCLINYLLQAMRRVDDEDDNSKHTGLQAQLLMKGVLFAKAALDTYDTVGSSLRTLDT